jgi:hypothetical protein
MLCPAPSHTASTDAFIVLYQRPRHFLVQGLVRRRWSPWPSKHTPQVPVGAGDWLDMNLAIAPDHELQAITFAEMEVEPTSVSSRSS